MSALLQVPTLRWVMFDAPPRVLSRAGSQGARLTGGAHRRHLGVRHEERDVVMLDIVFLAVTLLFFVVAAAYVSACERMK